MDEVEQLTQDQLRRLQEMQPASISPAAANDADGILLSALKALDRDDFVKYVEECRFRAGDVIFREGDHGDAMYLLWSGKLAVVKGSLHDPVEILLRGPGDSIGEMAIFNRKPRSASLVALEDSRLLKVLHSNIQALIMQQPIIGINMLSQLSERLRQARNSSSANKQQQQKLAKQLMDLRHQYAQLELTQRAWQETSDLIIHDLRNPLANMNIVFQMLEVMLPPDVIAANADLLDIARSANVRMRRLVDSMLDMRRIESGVLQPNVSFADLRFLVDESLQENQFGLERRNIQVTVRLPQQLPPIPCDEILIGRVLNNLVDNAIKYMPEGGRLEISAEVEPDFVRIAVSDDGPGIEPDHRERIFDRFAQASEEGARPQGFGLGLAFCKVAVAAHNGRIWVEPNEGGVGSRFIFTLPLKYEDVAGEKEERD